MAPLNRPDQGRWRRRLLVAAIFVVAEMAMVRRTPSQLSDRVLGNLGDPALIIWTYRWDAHGLLHHPLSMFTANIFWPYHNTLAYADDLLSIAPFYNIVYSLTHNWALSLNLLWLGAVGLNMGATYSLTRWLTHRTEAAVLAGLASGFSAFVLSQTGHPQLQLLGVLPLGVLLLFKLIERPNRSRAVAVGVVNVVILLGASYWAAAYAVATVVILGGWLVITRGHLGRALVMALAGAGAISALAIPTFLPYRQVQSVQGKRVLSPRWGLRPRDIIRATPGSYLYRQLARDTVPGAGERHLFPGFLTIALAGLGAAALALSYRRRRRPDPTDRPDRPNRPNPPHQPDPPDRLDPADRPDRRPFTVLLVAVGLALAVLAVGTNGHGVWTPWNFFYCDVPGFSGIRVTARLAAMTLVAGAVLAGVGLDAVLRRLGHQPARLAVTALACVVVLVELAGPLAWVPLPSDRATLAVYQALRHRPPGAVVELPMADPTTATDRWSYTEPPRMVWSTIDWHPRLNGYSGYLSPTYVADAQVLSTLPAPAAQTRLAERHIRYLIVHTGTQAGYQMFTEAQARLLLAGLPTGAGASAARFGPNYLVDLGPQ